MWRLSFILNWLRALGRLTGFIFRAVRGSRLGKWIIWTLFFYADGIVKKILGLLGISFVVNKWLVPELRPWIVEKFFGLDPVWSAYVGLLKLDQAITVLLSAIAIGMANKMAVERRKDHINQPL